LLAPEPSITQKWSVICYEILANGVMHTAHDATLSPDPWRSRTMKLNTLEDLFVEQLRDLYDAENQLVKALPKMAKASSCDKLKSAFESHLEETKHHVERLEQVFKTLGQKASGKTCAAMKGLVTEGSEMISENAAPDVKDAGLIAAAQRVEHYEMAGYGCVRTWARQLGKTEAVRLLEQTLNEEKAADQKLNTIAESHVNQQAVHAGA
jgi:ferritin-like metal-binding protein YciE